MSSYGGYRSYLGFLLCKFKTLRVQNACKLLLYWSSLMAMRWLLWFLRRHERKQIFSFANGHITSVEKMRHVLSIVTWWKPNRFLKNMGDFKSSWKYLSFATSRVYLSLVFKKLQNEVWIIHSSKLLKKLHSVNACFFRNLYEYKYWKMQPTIDAEWGPTKY